MWTAGGYYTEPLLAKSRANTCLALTTRRHLATPLRDRLVFSSALIGLVLRVLIDAREQLFEHPPDDGLG